MTGATDKKTIILIGGYPPPYGGITVHIKRLAQILSNQEYHVIVIPTKKIKKQDLPTLDYHVINFNIILKSLYLLFLCLYKKNLVVHMHVSAFERFQLHGLILLALTFNTRRIITLHSGRILKFKLSNFKRRYLRCLVSKFNKIIVVSEALKNFLIELGVSTTPAVIPAYIRSDPSEENVNLLPIAHKDKEFILTSGILNKTYDHKTILTSAKHFLDQKIIFIFTFYGIPDDEHRKAIINEIEKTDNCIFFDDLGPDSFSALLNKAKCYVRSTLADGDSVVVREALDYQVPVFATSCVERPEGCHLFDIGDSSHLVKYIEKLIRNEIEKPEANLDYDFSKNLLATYKETFDND